MRLVNLTKRVMVNGGLRYCPVVEAANGRIRPDVVMVEGTEERHPEGCYYIDYREGEKRIRVSVGKNAADAQSARLSKQAELNAVKAGLEILDASVMIGGQAKHSLAAAIASCLEDIELTKKHRTHLVYKTALEYFQESCHKQFVEDIDRKDMLNFSAFLRDDKDQSPRSVYNKFESVMAFLKLQGITSKRDEHGVVRPLVNKNDWPRFTEEEPEVYEREEVSRFLNACEPNERLWFEFFLMTGMREQEVMYTYWSDIQFSKCTVKVTHKPDRDWTPKAYKEREIPVPESLIASLKAAKAWGLSSSLRDIWLQTEKGFSRLLQSHREACRAQPRSVLAPQVPCDVSDVDVVEAGRSENGAVVSRARRHRIDDEISEACWSRSSPRTNELGL